MRRRLISGGFLAMAVCGALTACGAQQATSSGSGTASSTTGSGSASSTAFSSGTSAPLPPAQGSATLAASTRCAAATLAGRIEPTDAGAGNRYGRLIVTNTGSAMCTLNGYSGLQLLDSARQPLPTSTERMPNPAPALVQLAPGASAAADLRWSVVPYGDEPQDRPCQPEAPSATAIPPDETQPISLVWGLGPVCGAGRIDISAFYAA